MPRRVCAGQAMPRGARAPHCLTLPEGPGTIAGDPHAVPMQLLVAVINHAELVDDVLAGFVELGITGATIVESKGMGRLLAQEVPIFAGLRTLNTRSRTANRTIFCVADDAKVDAAIRMIEETCGDMGGAGMGIVFTLPVGRVVGLAPELGE
jgi:nitrogen regulatory protein P-II 1